MGYSPSMFSSVWFARSDNTSLLSDAADTFDAIYRFFDAMIGSGASSIV